ncbi:hypothetical protein ACF1BE_33050 [Streptomyces sp. NPDC014991]|uniref:mannitol dehydrogenase family protein n=1 Tax=Streptomyces sp. NPDC014991 TaxID=3364935 RepID=UPI0036FC1F55
MLPSLHEARAQGRPRTGLAFSVAAWMRYLRGDDLGGRPIDVQDARADELREAALRGGDDPGPLLAFDDIVGDLAVDRDTVADIRRFLSARDGSDLHAAVPPTAPRAA